MTDAVAIVAAMHADIDRFGNELGVRTDRLARAAITDLQRDLDKRSLGRWGMAARVSAIAQLRSGMERLAGRQAGVLTDAVPAIAGRSQARLASLLNHLDTRFTGSVYPLRFDTAAWLEGNTRRLSRTRLQVYPASFARYGAEAVQQIEDVLGRLALTGKPWTEARGPVHRAIRGVVGERQWMVDRILRTETSAIYNGTALDAMIAEDTPEAPMLKRLAATFDTVTGRDSVYVHGQIRPVREPFSDGKRSYMAPPNRPHDRELVVPHRSTWGSDPPRLSPSPPDPEDTSAPDLPAARPGPERSPPPALARRLALAAAGVTVLAGRVQEQRIADAPAPLPALEHRLADAQLELAAARLAADLEAGEGITVGSLHRGETVTAGGLAVRVEGVRDVGDAVEVVLRVGDVRLRGTMPKRLRIPLRRSSPTMSATEWQAQAAVAMVADAIRHAAAAATGSRTSSLRLP